MTKHTPTGTVRHTPNGLDLVLTREFGAPVDDVWASLTESDRTARWFGPWRGDPGTGCSIEVQMIQEEGAPWMPMIIEVCEAPHRLGLSAVDDYGAWLLDLELTESNGVTTLRFVQHRVDPNQAGDVAAGWEWYLDLLVSSRDGEPAPDFGDYHPGLKEPYEQLAAAAMATIEESLRELG